VQRRELHHVHVVLTLGAHPRADPQLPRARHAAQPDGAQRLQLLRCVARCRPATQNTLRLGLASRHTLRPDQHPPPNARAGIAGHGQQALSSPASSMLAHLCGNNATPLKSPAPPMSPANRALISPCNPEVRVWAGDSPRASAASVCVAHRLRHAA
jgi:hypothetical protein